MAKLFPSIFFFMRQYLMDYKGADTQIYRHLGPGCLEARALPSVKLKQCSLSHATKNDHNAALLVGFSECISLISSLVIVLNLLIPLSCPQSSLSSGLSDSKCLSNLPADTLFLKRQGCANRQRCTLSNLSESIGRPAR